jgi:hypothetical protein
MCLESAAQIDGKLPWLGWTEVVMVLRRWSFLALHLGLFLACSTILSAQLNRGVIEGTVTDAQGAAVPGVEVTVTALATNVTNTTKTNSAGYYRAEALVPGTYRARFAASGFASLEITAIDVPAAQVIRVDARLKVGSVTENVQVKAELPMLETDASNFSTTLQTDIIQNVPLAGRDLQQLTFLLPGVNNVGGPPGSNFGFDSSFGTFPDPTHLLGSAIAVNGGQSGTNAWYLDGNLNISSFGENIVVNPSPDSVSEFQAITNAFSAEYSHTGGGVFNVVLKSGTNAFHGDIYEYLRNSATNATNPFEIQGGFGRPVVQFNDFGGALGGPVRIPHIYNGKNKTFFFFSLDATILHQRGNNAYTVPTPLMRQGDFSEDPNVVSNGIWDPVSTAGPQPDGTFLRTAFGTPAPGNPFGAQGCLNSSVDAGAAMTPAVTTCNFSTKIPTDRLDPTAMFFINSFPLPNHIDTLGGCPLAASGTYSICNNFEGKTGSSQDPINLSIKIDHQTGKGKYFFEWLFSPTQYRNYAVPWTGPTFPQELIGFGSPYNFNVRSQVIALGHTYAFNPDLVNEFRVSFSRQFLSTLSHPYPNSVTALPAVEQALAPSRLPSNAFFPTPNFHIDNTPGGGFIAFGPEAWVNIATGSEAYTILDNVTKIIGKHTMKMGFIYRLDHASYESDDPTILDFNASLAQDPISGLGGNGLAQFMMGAVPADGGGSGSFAGHLQSPYIRWRSWGAFVQDDFHIKPNFTLNVGLRFDLNGYFRARYYPMANFCFTCLNRLTGLPGENIYEGSPGFPNGDVFPANHTDFAPRFNFSWAPTRTTVVRAGYDIFYTDAIENFNAPGQSVVNGAGWGQSAAWSTSFYSPCQAFAGPCEAFPLSDTTTNKTNLLFPSITGPFPAQIRENLLGGTYAFVKPTHDPMVQSYTLELQHEFPAGLSVSLAYVGTHGTHLSGSGPNAYLYNNVSTQNKLKYQSLLFSNYPISQFFSGQTATQLGLLYGNPQTGPVNQLQLSTLLEPYPFFPTIPTNGTFDGVTTYNGMNLRVQKRYSNGLDFIAAYTVSKQMDNWSVGGAGVEAIDPIHFTRGGIIGGRGGALVSVFGGPFTFQDPDNRKADRTIAVDDIPQQFNVGASYELPVGSGKALLNRGGIIGGILGGWKLSGDFNAQEGLPLAISCPSSTLQQLSTPGTSFQESGGRCNMIGDPHFSGHRSKAAQIADWINPAAFEPAFGNDPTFWANYSITDPRAWTFGNMKSRTDAIRGPGFWNLDSSLMKDFHLTEARYVEFRWEVFNALNHQNLGLPNTTFCLPPNPDGSTDLVHQAGCTFGRITNVQTDPRNMTFALKFFF